MNRADAIARLLIKIFALPEPAPAENYAEGRGVVLPSLAFRRWSVWVPTTLAALFTLLPIGGLIAIDLFGTRPLPIPGWAYGAMVAAALLFVVYAAESAKVTFLMLEYRFDELGLHIRRGSAIVREITLSYRNIQNVSIQRGPIDLLLGLSKVVVDTAGGGGAVAGAQGAGAAMAAIAHRGLMEGIDRFMAEDIRADLIERMKQFQGAGLGEFSESRAKKAKQAVAATPGAPALGSEQLALLRQALENLRAARTALAPELEAKEGSLAPEGSVGM
jgi:membrane protein YdbS with pleckstrin-like domain